MSFDRAAAQGEACLWKFVFTRFFASYKCWSAHRTSKRTVGREVLDDRCTGHQIDGIARNGISTTSSLDVYDCVPHRTLTSRVQRSASFGPAEDKLQVGRDLLCATTGESLFVDQLVLESAALSPVRLCTTSLPSFYVQLGQKIHVAQRTEMSRTLFRFISSSRGLSCISVIDTVFLRSTCICSVIFDFDNQCWRVFWSKQCHQTTTSRRILWNFNRISHGTYSRTQKCSGRRKTFRGSGAHVQQPCERGKALKPQPMLVSLRPVLSPSSAGQAKQAALPVKVHETRNVKALEQPPLGIADVC